MLPVMITLAVAIAAASSNPCDAPIENGSANAATAQRSVMQVQDASAPAVVQGGAISSYMPIAGGSAPTVIHGEVSELASGVPIARGSTTDTAASVDAGSTSAVVKGASVYSSTAGTVVRGVAAQCGRGKGL